MNSPQARQKHTSSLVFIKHATPYVNGRVLDVECGDKTLKRLFPDHEWVGVDRRPVGDVVSHPEDMSAVFGDDEFDTVVLYDMLQYSPSPLMVMKEASRVLKPGGYLIVTAPNTFPDDRQAFWSFSGRGMEYLALASGLEVEKLLVEGRVFSHEWAEEFGNTRDEVKGWLGRMDELYPQVTFMVAKKGR